MLMAEAAALALAAQLSDSLNFLNTTFLSDCQVLVDFLNHHDRADPPDWRIKPYIQIFSNYSSSRQVQLIKIDRNLNDNADRLARQALSASVSSTEQVCSYVNHDHQCPLSVALNNVNLHAVSILSALCCQ